ncbi:peptidoglycan-binding protein [Clostridium estertheticum]|uniref:peptidoglycan-binding domain-containing protein n=1 Tax=Clostridium estertheticum TaxID=238834 RepID=UPI001CD1537E|nr:peptidoglycan-binding domain-containing protein [Clostridium estertheticum]MBZ9688611.1 peptidoglycan-binding protein [Clostridium estertheticum]
MLKPVSGSLVAIFAISIAVASPKIGPFGVDGVSAATGAVPVTTTTPTKITTSTATISVTRLLKFNSMGADVKLLQTKLNSKGYSLVDDGILGKLTLAAVKSYQGKNGLVVDGMVGPKTLAMLNAVVVTPTPPTVPPVVISEKTTIKIGRAEAAAHGTKCFTVAVVAMAGDKIVAASIDDYQFMVKATSIGVPNSDLDFGKSFTDVTKVLASKRSNAEAYSKNMKDSAGATISIDKNYDAVQAFAVGKTVAELEAIIKTNPIDPKVDVVTSATLTDTNNYLSAIVAAAKTAKENSPIKVETSALNSLKIGRVEAAAHGTKCFTVAVTVMAGDKIVGASIDDYQFMTKASSIAVPNSDLDFGKNYADVTKVLASKRANAEAYSKNMKDSAGATIAIDVNYDAVQAFADGKTVAELEAAIKTNGTDPKVDAVTSATLTDTNGYLNAILAAAKAAK